MPFKAGQSGNPSGRPKGALGESTQAKRDLVAWIKEDGMERFISEVQTLEGSQFCKVFKDVVEFALPKQSRVETKHEGEVTVQQKPLQNVYGKINTGDVGGDTSASK